MKFVVQIIGDAEDDIFDIYKYIAVNDTVASAEYIFEKLQEICFSLAANPERGHYPPEFERIGITEYREIHFKLYRVIYKILDRDVFVYCVVDGRRDLQELLERRLLR